MCNHRQRQRQRHDRHKHIHTRTLIHSHALKVRPCIASWCKQSWTAQQIRCKREHGENMVEQKKTAILLMSLSSYLYYSTVFHLTLLCVRSPQDKNPWWINSIHTNAHIQQRSTYINSLSTWFSSVQFNSFCLNLFCRNVKLSIHVYSVFICLYIS